MIFKIIYSTYAKSDLEEVVVSAVQMDTNQHKNLPGILKEFEDLFDETLGNGILITLTWI